MKGAQIVERETPPPPLKKKLKIQAKPHRDRAIPVTGGGTETQAPCLPLQYQVVFRSPGQGIPAIPSVLEF